MPAIKPVPYQTLAKIFESEGFTLHRQRGDHPIYSKPEVKRPLVIPMYSAVPVFIIKPACLTGFRREESETPSQLRRVPRARGARPEERISLRPYTRPARSSSHSHSDSPSHCRRSL